MTSVKDVYLHAAGKTYSGVGDLHVLILWWDAIDKHVPVSQVVQLTGQAGSYQFYAPITK